MNDLIYGGVKKLYRDYYNKHGKTMSIEELEQTKIDVLKAQLRKEIMEELAPKKEIKKEENPKPKQEEKKKSFKTLDLLTETTELEPETDEPQKKIKSKYGNKEYSYSYDRCKYDQKEYSRRHYELHKEILNQTNKCECGGTYTVRNKNAHVKTKIHQKYINNY